MDDFKRQALATLRKVQTVIDSTDEESPAFLDSGADSIALLLEAQADIAALLASDKKPALKCPACGASQGIYARIDARWQPTVGNWQIVPDLEGDLDCTNCDHHWALPDGVPNPAREAAHNIVPPKFAD